MKTVADSYIEEGYNKAALQFDAKLHQEKVDTAKNFLKAGVSADVVASSTRLSKSEVDELKD